MAILSDVDIEQYILSEGIIENYRSVEEQLQPASFDVRLADGILKPVGAPTLIRPDNVSEIEYTEHEGKYAIAPGEFILASTMELVNLPDDLVAVVNGRSTFGRLGITVHVTAGYVDPGFRGTITLEIYNCGPVTVELCPGERIAQLVFERLSTRARTPYGAPGSNNKYQDQIGVTAPRVEDLPPEAG